MRTRRDIEQNTWHLDVPWENLKLEVLLDIRELLIKQSQTKTEFPQLRPLSEEEK